MIIELPEEFSFRDEKKGKIAFIENGILKMTRQVSFRNVMISISYQMKGKGRCCYCNKIITEDKITIDHMFPVDFGGPTITNNLLPACRRCNQEKSNMTYQQYMAFLEAKSTNMEKQYLKLLKQYQENIRDGPQYQIPREWITERDIKEIIININLEENYQSKKYRALQNYYLEYGKLRGPIVLDRNSFLLDGFLRVMLAKNYQIVSVPAIELENVEVMI